MEGYCNNCHEIFNDILCLEIECNNCGKHLCEPCWNLHSCCDFCNGTGYIDYYAGSHDEPCPMCGGTGVL